MKTTLVIAPHPDDEVYGCGGTIAGLARHGEIVHVLIVTKGDDLFDPELIRQGREAARQAHEILGVSETHFADLPAIKLDTLPQYKIAEVLAGYVKKSNRHDFSCRSRATSTRTTKLSMAARWWRPGRRRASAKSIRMRLSVRPIGTHPDSSPRSYPTCSLTSPKRLAQSNEVC